MIATLRNYEEIYLFIRVLLYKENTMRLWSIHPKYLDSKGLVALWREGLLAQKVLSGQTKGYKNHPQLDRFKTADNPECLIATYLQHVFMEAQNRGYKFDGSKILDCENEESLTVSKDQLEYEFKHLLSKLVKRDPALFIKYKNLRRIKCHPLFNIKPGRIADWEFIS